MPIGSRWCNDSNKVLQKVLHIEGLERCILLWSLKKIGASLADGERVCSPLGKSQCRFVRFRSKASPSSAVTNCFEEQLLAQPYWRLNA